MNDLGGVGVPLNQSSGFNQMNVNNSTHCDHVTSSALVFFMVFYCLVFVVGLVLNGFTLKVYFCRSQRKTSSCVTIYLKNLAAADFLMSLCLLIRIANSANRSVLIHQIFCSFGVPAFYLNMYASTLFMCYIAANRYLKIVHPLGTHVLQTVRAAHILSTVTWVFLLTIMSAYIILSLLTQETLSSVPYSVSCDVLRNKQFSLFYDIIHTLSAAVFLFVLIALFFFYYSTSRRLSLAQQKHPASPGNKKLTKSRRNMLVLVSVFCVCFVPYHLVRLLFVFMRKQCTWRQAFFFPKELSIMVSALNVCLDPLIYFIFCKAFRAQLSPKKVPDRSLRTKKAQRGEAEQTSIHDVGTQQEEMAISASSKCEVCLIPTEA